MNKYGFDTVQRRLKNGNRHLRREGWPQTHSLKLVEDGIIRYDRLNHRYVDDLTIEDRVAKDWVDPGE